MRHQTSAPPRPAPWDGVPLWRRVFAGVFGFPRPRKPAPQSLPCACACGEDHDLPPALAAVLAQRRAGPEASPEVSARDWAPAFADEVRQGQVINIPRSDVAGLALSVLRVRTHEEGGEFGGAAVTFLAVNVADPSMPVAPTLSIHAGLRIAVSAPDSLAGMGGVS